MKHKRLCVFLLLEAAVCLILAGLEHVLPDVFPALAAFPFAQLGLGLRALSLSGSAGNIAAILLYALLCLLPAGGLLLLHRKQPLHAEDCLLVLLTAAMFPVLWLLVNPGRMAVPGSEGVYCAILWSLLVSWLALRLLRALFASDRQQLTKWFAWLCRMMAAYYVFELCGVLFPALLEEFTRLQAEGCGGTELGFAVFSQLVGAMPGVLTIVMLFRTLSLTDAITGEEASVPALAASLSRFCGFIAAVSIASTAFMNLMQLLLQDSLRNIHISVVIPVFELLIVLSVLLLARYIAENRALRDDNELFI